MAFRPTDIELIREVLHDSNAHAFETLMKRYTTQVYGAALRLMKDEENAKEVTQMAFIQAYRQLDSWRSENFGAWVTIIANHIALQLLATHRTRLTTSRKSSACNRSKPPLHNFPKPTGKSSNGIITRTSLCRPSPNASGKRKTILRYACTAYANESKNKCNHDRSRIR